MGMPTVDAGYPPAMNDAAPSHVTGHFGSPESARAALVRLEGAGFDGDAIELIGLRPDHALPTAEAAEAADYDAIGGVARHAGTGATVGAVAGAAAGVVTGIVTGDVGTGAAVGAAAAAGGGAIGGLAGTYAGLPVNEGAWTTYELDPADSHPITVRVRVSDGEEAQNARTALQG